MERFDVAVVGLGALGSGAAYQAAIKGARVTGFEHFELGHIRGTSIRMIRHASSGLNTAPLNFLRLRGWRTKTGPTCKSDLVYSWSISPAALHSFPEAGQLPRTTSQRVLLRMVSRTSSLIQRQSTKSGPGSKSPMKLMRCTRQIQELSMPASLSLPCSIRVPTGLH